MYNRGSLHRAYRERRNSNMKYGDVTRSNVNDS